MSDDQMNHQHKYDFAVSRRSLLTGLGVASMAALLESFSMTAESETSGVFEIKADWQLRVNPGTVLIDGKRYRIKKAAEIVWQKPSQVSVRAEKHTSLPRYNAAAAGWAKGAKPARMETYECTSAGMLFPGTFTMRSAIEGGKEFVAGKDFDIDAMWSTFGSLPGGAIPENGEVFVDYICGLNRVDSLFLMPDGSVQARFGEPHAATPHPPTAPEKAINIANVWVPGRLERLVPDSIYPIVERVFPADQNQTKAVPAAASLLPKTWKKIQNGEPLKILAWGDSVTAGGQASDDAHRYQSVFVSMLKRKYPGSKPILTTSGWGGRNTDSFLNEPPGAEFNFDHAVIEPRPDLIVMEFVNDAYMTPEVLETKYSYLLKRFQEIGAEWIILTPHFVRPDWMGETSVRVEVDRRPYVTGVRAFCAKHNIAIADASLRWGHLVKEGIPYTTLLCNSINHPDDRGHEMFARAIMQLF